MKESTKEYIKLEAYELLLAMYDYMAIVQKDELKDTFEDNWLSSVDNLMWYREQHDTEHATTHNTLL